MASFVQWKVRVSEYGLPFRFRGLIKRNGSKHHLDGHSDIADLSALVSIQCFPSAGTSVWSALTVLLSGKCVISEAVSVDSPVLLGSRQETPRTRIKIEKPEDVNTYRRRIFLAMLNLECSTRCP
jgi:hypothetical protein